jgi:predicted nuclease with TOPRIM domain
MANDIRARQDHYQFLEDYIKELTEKIDELTGGRDWDKEIASVAYRLEVLGKSNGRFPTRVKELEKELGALKAQYEKIKPQVEELEEERAFYRDLQSEI